MKEEFEKRGYKLTGFCVDYPNFEVEFINENYDIITLTDKGVSKTDKQYRLMKLTEEEEKLVLLLQLAMWEKMYNEP